jgi:hypothetical protein
MIKNILKHSILTLLGIYFLGSFIVYHVDCWEQRNRIFNGTVVQVNNSMGKYSSTCLLNVNWDGIGEQVINAGSMGCRSYQEGSRISVPRGWNFISGKDGTAYIPSDPKLISDNWIVEVGAMGMVLVMLLMGVYGLGLLL